MKVKRNKRSLKGAKKCSKEKKKFKRNKRHEEEFKKKKKSFARSHGLFFCLFDNHLSNNDSLLIFQKGLNSVKRRFETSTNSAEFDPSIKKLK